MIIDKLIIDRFKWGRGTLLRTDGRMCCLGHLSKACGISDTLMSEHYYPSDNWDINPEFKFNNDKVNMERKLVIKASKLNDYAWGKPADKERDLITLFKDNGIDLTFIGEYLNGVDNGDV